MITVNFQNSYSSTVWIATIFYDPPDCTGYGDWMIRGWWKVEPGETISAFDTTNQYAGFYAEAANGAYWAGDAGPYLLTREQMSLCYSAKPDMQTFVVGMRTIDANPPWWAAYWSYTINLTS